MKNKRIMRDPFLLGVRVGGERSTFCKRFAGFALSSFWSDSMKMKVYDEDVRMVTVVAWNKG